MLPQISQISTKIFKMNLIKLKQINNYMKKRMSKDKSEMVEKTEAFMLEMKTELMIMRALCLAEENGMDFNNVTDVRTYVKDKCEKLEARIREFEEGAYFK